MAYRVGGLEGINKAIECNSVATCQYSSGLQVTGVFTDVLADAKGEPIYLRSTGPTRLPFENKELAGTATDYHEEGFGSPIGAWKATRAARRENGETGISKAE